MAIKKRPVGGYRPRDLMLGSVDLDRQGELDAVKRIGQRRTSEQYSNARGNNYMQTEGGQIVRGTAPQLDTTNRVDQLQREYYQRRINPDFQPTQDLTRNFGAVRPLLEKTPEGQAVASDIQARFNNWLKGFGRARASQDQPIESFDQFRKIALGSEGYDPMIAGMVEDWLSSNVPKTIEEARQMRRQSELQKDQEKEMTDLRTQLQLDSLSMKREQQNELVDKAVKENPDQYEKGYDEKGWPIVVRKTESEEQKSQARAERLRTIAAENENKVVGLDKDGRPILMDAPTEDTTEEPDPTPVDKANFDLMLQRARVYASGQLVDSTGEVIADTSTVGEGVAKEAEERKKRDIARMQMLEKKYPSLYNFSEAYDFVEPPEGQAGNEPEPEPKVNPDRAPRNKEKRPPEGVSRWAD